jgi:hypothetical protein
MNLFRRKADDQEVKLWSNKREREDMEAKADLFALIKTVDRLEKAYVRDAIRCVSCLSPPHPARWQGDTGGRVHSAEDCPEVEGTGVCSAHKGAHTPLREPPSRGVLSHGCVTSHMTTNRMWR